MNTCEALSRFLAENQYGADPNNSAARGPLQRLKLIDITDDVPMPSPPNGWLFVDGEFVGGAVKYGGGLTLPLVPGAVYPVAGDGRIALSKTSPDAINFVGAVIVYVFPTKESAHLAKSLAAARNFQQLVESNANLASLITNTADIGNIFADTTSIVASLGGGRSEVTATGTFTNTASQTVYEGTLPSWARRAWAIIRLTAASGTLPTVAGYAGITNAAGSYLGSGAGRSGTLTTAGAGVGVIVGSGDVGPYAAEIGNSLSRLISGLPLARGAGKNTFGVYTGGTSPLVSGTYEIISEA